jgi:hypothetical protein
VTDHSYILRPCPNGDRCFECLDGFHRVRVDGPTPETVDEAISMIADGLRGREVTVVAFEIDYGDGHHLLLYCRWDGRVLWPTSANPEEAFMARHLKMKRFDRAAMEAINRMMLDALQLDRWLTPGRDPWRGLRPWQRSFGSGSV